MYEGLQDEEWQHTSSILAMLHNLQCSKKAQMKPPTHFNPLLKGKKKKRLTKDQTTRALKMFLETVSKGEYEKSDCKYELIDGAYVLVDSKKTEEK